MTEKNSSELFKTAMTTINITQSWDRIISEIKRKFTELLDLLRDKESEIVEKLERKK